MINEYIYTLLSLYDTPLQVSVDDSGLTVGGSVTLTRLNEEMKTLVDTLPGEDILIYCRPGIFSEAHIFQNLADLGFPNHQIFLICMCK